MRQNVVEWICGTMTDATSAIVLTHNIDFLFLQSIVRPRLRKCGHPKLTIFADAACAAGSYRQQRYVLEGLGRHYRVVPVEMGVGRRFHPKAIFLAGPRKSALAVGSGNVTHGGWSANHEIWATYESDDDGRPAISAFRGYLDTVLGLIHRTQSISEEVLAAFDQTTNSWAAELPEPAGLLGIPGDRPLLERIIDLAGNDVRQVTVCAPYFDPDGEALGEFARRIPAPVRTLLQRNHVGLSASAAAALPANVELSSIDIDPSRFIHAKVFALHRPDTTLLVAGSANLSRAALMADGTWGNAELIAVQEISHERADDLLADLKILEESPVLPEAPPSEEWEIPTQPIRILAARFVDGALEIAFKSDAPLQYLAIEMDDGAKTRCSDFPSKETAQVLLNRCPRFIRLHCTLENGLNVSSEPAWVDDEASLDISVPERRIAAKLMEAAEAGSLSASGMFEILQLLHQHLRQPTKRTAQSTTAVKNSAAPPPRGYSVEDVFSENFGRPRLDPVASLPGGFRESDFFRAFTAYFTLADTEEATGEQEPTEPDQPNDDLVDGGEPEEIEDAKAKEDIELQQARHRRSEEGLRLRKKLVGALENVVTAMSADEFIAGRPPERLGADIAATALLLRKGLVDQIISEDDFASITERLWSVLFFGSKGESGVIQKHLGSSPAELSASFESAIASPRLSAALTMWCFPDWGDGSTDAIKFRFAAMVLAARLPWLIAGGTVEEVAGELRRLSRAMPTGAEFETLHTAWRNWVQAGAAFGEFENVVKGWTPKDLADAVDDDEVKRGDLLWQAGELCVAETNYRRDSKTKALVRPLAGSDPKKLIGSWLVPVASLLQGPNLLKLHEGARTLLLSIIAEIQVLDGNEQGFW